MHASGIVPRTQGYIEIEIPASLSIEEITQDDVPHWDSLSFETAGAFGDRWYDQQSTPVLIVPPVGTLVERNVLINQEHPDSLHIQVSRAGFCRWRHAPPAEDAEIDLRDEIQRIALEWPCYGWRRMTAELRRRGWTVNHKRDQFRSAIPQRVARQHCPRLLHRHGQHSDTSDLDEAPMPCHTA